MKRIEPVILIAAVGFYVLAMVSQGVLPLLEKSVTRPLIVHTIDGKTVPSPVRTEDEESGRRVYIRDGCWYCHSQYVRPVNRDVDKRVADADSVRFRNKWIPSAAADLKHRVPDRPAGGGLGDRAVPRGRREIVLGA